MNFSDFAKNSKNQLIITAVLFALWAFFAVCAPGAFLSGSIYMTFLSTIPFIMIVATAMTLVVVTGEMDLSFASNMAMSGFVFALVSKATGSVLVGAAAGVAAGLTIGFVNGFMITTWRCRASFSRSCRRRRAPCSLARRRAWRPGSR